MDREQLAFVVEYLRTSLKPYRDRFPRHATLPAAGVPREDLLAEMRAMREAEAQTWESGHASGAVYWGPGGGGDQGWSDFLDEVYALNSEVNPLHPDLWPRGTRYEAEVVAMTADIMGAGMSPTREADGGVAGLMTSGGTDSILTAVRCARDHWRERVGVDPAGADRGPRPQVVMPTTAHVAFDKAAHYFDMESLRVPALADGRADVAATARAVGERTAVVVGSAGPFPHGVVDPIAELSAMSLERAIWFHTDACLGGFVLPFARALYERGELDEPVPDFDFRLPGVTSLSVDTHKFGYAAKGSSVLLFRDADLRHYSYHRSLDWPGGLYNSPSAPGSRAGALVAQAWAAMLAMGEEGYVGATRRIVSTTKAIRSGLAEVPGIRMLGESLLVVAFTTEGFGAYALQDLLSARGWNLTGLQRPAGLHLTVTQRTAQSGVAERFVADVASACDELRADPGRPSLMTPIYGLGSGGLGSGGPALPGEVGLDDVLTAYLDVQYEV
jgi:sphinganine-1-phosphate aldolase